MESNYRTKLIRTLTFLGGVYFFLEFVLPVSVLKVVGVADIHSEITAGFRAFGAVAVGLGIINLLLAHGSRLLYLRKNWIYSCVLLFGLFSMTTVATLDWRESSELTSIASEYSSLGGFAEVIVKDVEQENKIVLPYQERTRLLGEAVRELFKELPNHLQGLSPLDDKDKLLADSYIGKLKSITSSTLPILISLESQETLQKDQYTSLSEKLVSVRTELQKLLFLKQKYATTKQLYDFLYEGLFVALGSAMFSLLAMYIAAAAYRAFRIKTVESGLMMLAALIVMLGQIPFYAYISHDLPFIRSWLLEVPNSAAFRAIKIGASIAGLVMAFRMWFSIESESFSQKENT